MTRDEALMMITVQAVELERAIVAVVGDIDNIGSAAEFLSAGIDRAVLGMPSILDRLLRRSRKSRLKRAIDAGARRLRSHQASLERNVPDYQAAAEAFAATLAAYPTSDRDIVAMEKLAGQLEEMTQLARGLRIAGNTHSFGTPWDQQIARQNESIDKIIAANQRLIATLRPGQVTQ